MHNFFIVRCNLAILCFHQFVAHFFDKMPEIPFAFQWTINENELLPLKDSTDGCLRSASVSNILEFKYYMKIHPNGHNEEHRGKTIISLAIKFKDVKKVEADYKYAIESANFSTSANSVHEKSLHCWGLQVCDTSELFDPEKKYIVDGKFVVKVYGIFKFESENNIIAAVDEQKWDGGELGNKLWKKEDTKDFTIIADDGKEIMVHKFMLENLSEVFSAMLKSNMKESKENKIVLTDFSFHIVETALKIIYDCNFTTTLTMNELMLLLQFFDKYQLPTLKEKVESFLINQIFASTVCRITTGAILTNSFKLKGICMEFLSTAFTTKMPLSDFQDLDKDIVFEIVHNSFYRNVETEK